MRTYVSFVKLKRASQPNERRLPVMMIMGLGGVGGWAVMLSPKIGFGSGYTGSVGEKFPLWTMARCLSCFDLPKVPAKIAVFLFLSGNCCPRDGRESRWIAWRWLDKTGPGQADYTELRLGGFVCFSLSSCRWSSLQDRVPVLMDGFTFGRLIWIAGTLILRRWSLGEVSWNLDDTARWFLVGN